MSTVGLLRKGGGRQRADGCLEEHAAILESPRSKVCFDTSIWSASASVVQDLSICSYHVHAHCALCACVISRQPSNVTCIFACHPQASVFVCKMTSAWPVGGDTHPAPCWKCVIDCLID